MGYVNKNYPLKQAGSSLKEAKEEKKMN